MRLLRISLIAFFLLQGVLTMALTKQETIDKLYKDAQNTNATMYREELDGLFKGVLLEKFTKEEVVQIAKNYVATAKVNDSGNGLNVELRQVAILGIAYYNGYPDMTKKVKTVPWYNTVPAWVKWGGLALGVFIVGGVIQKSR